MKARPSTKHPYAAIEHRVIDTGYSKRVALEHGLA